MHATMPIKFHLFYFQISLVYRIDEAIPGNYHDLVGHFSLLLQYSSIDRPLYIFLDGVDQLSPSDGALSLAWLPLKLPQSVRIILSVSSEVKYRCYHITMSLLKNVEECFIEVIESVHALIYNSCS